MKDIEFFYDFTSPASYLGYFKLKALAEQYNARVIYRPLLLGGVMNATGNRPPGLVPSKGKWMLEDLARFAKRYNLPFHFNPTFPLNSIHALRGCYVLEGSGNEEAYRDAVFKAAWQEKKNIGDPQILSEVIQAAGIDPEPIIAGIQTDEIKQQLKDTTEEACNRGAFGAPTIFIEGQMHFGQDRFDFIEELLAKS